MGLEDPAIRRVFAAYGFDEDGALVREAPGGLIQKTLLLALRDGRRFVVQRLHPVFSADVMHDIDAVTAHIEKKGLPTPRPVRTLEGALSVDDDEGRTWRVMTYLDGHTVDQLASPDVARAAGALVARFHVATTDLEWTFRFHRAGVHDTAAHLARLEAASAASDANTRHLVPLAHEILEAAAALPSLDGLPRRIAHGDLKISNVLFADDGTPRALIDLDTLGHLPLAFELGDAWRSWCNPRGEDTADTCLDEALFEAAATGYANVAQGLVTPDERDSLVPGLLAISLELAARFCTDAFEDRYFGWDPARFASRREHNRIRARGQLTLHRNATARKERLQQAVRRAFEAAA